MLGASDGRVIAGRYELDALLGHGGMGDVYAAHDVRLDRPVAVKLLRGDLAADPVARGHFEREARMAARINDPNVVAIFDTGEDDVPFIVMERLSGRTLADEISEGRFTSDRLHRVAVDILSALHSADANGVVHRDVKPGNVLIGADGDVKVADFGIAKTTDDVSHTIALFGTAAYVAPERLDGRPASRQSDLFSVGVVLYEAATGHRPFHAATPLATVHAIAHDDAPSLATLRPDLDASFVDAVQRAMRKDPDERFSSATEMAAALWGSHHTAAGDAETVRIDPDRTVALAATPRVRSRPRRPSNASSRRLAPPPRHRDRRPDRRRCDRGVVSEPGIRLADLPADDHVGCCRVDQSGRVDGSPDDSPDRRPHDRRPHVRPDAGTCRREGERQGEGQGQVARRFPAVPVGYRTAMRGLLARLANRLGEERRVDAVADPVAGAVRQSIPAGVLKDTLSGVWLGHPVHPMLTDLPIGFWTSAFVLDLVGGRAAREPASRLVGLGVLSAVPAMFAGASDWGDTTGPARRIGLVHAVANSTAVVCYGASWWNRRKGRHLRGVTYGLLGATAATVGGYLGGHLVQELGIGVDNTVFESRPDEWTRVCAASDVMETPRCFDVSGVPVVVFHHAGEVVALGGRCPHRGAPMADGTLDCDTIVCPWHDSQFRIADGAVERGPAAMPLPSYDCRRRGEDIEVRARS